MLATIIDAEHTAVDKVYPPKKILPPYGLHTDGEESQRTSKTCMLNCCKCYEEKLGNKGVPEQELGGGLNFNLGD